MKITHLSLKQFRCFEHFDIDLVHPITVLVGKNASGKTAVLDALTTGLAAWGGVLGTGEAAELRLEDVRAIARADGVEDEQMFPAEVLITFETTKVSQAQFLRFDRGPSSGGSYVEVGVAMRLAASRGASLPVLLAFGTDRAIGPSGAADLRPEARPTRSTAYEAVRSTLPQRARMRDWLAHQTFIELQDGIPLPELRSVTHAVHECIEGASGFRYSVKRGALEIRIDGATMPLDRLSDGQRTLLLLVADIARRAAQLNPHLGENAARDTEGVVLLDEVELHLHPAWQRQVLPSLRRAFPNMQFIVTTHSPQVVASVEAGQVLVLRATESGRSVEAVPFVEGRDSNSLLLDVFGELERPLAWRQELDALHVLIDEGELAKAREKLGAIEARFGSDDPEVVRARWSIDVETSRDGVEGTH